MFFFSLFDSLAQLLSLFILHSIFVFKNKDNAPKKEEFIDIKSNRDPFFSAWLPAP